MAIYGVSGNEIPAAYTIGSKAMTTVYDRNGRAFSADGTALRVMTYNVGGWYIGSGTNVPATEDEAYYALHNGTIQRNDPDILVIQEYWSTFSKTGRTALSMLEQYFPYIEALDSGTYFGRAICSKYPITGYTKRTYTNESSRYFDSCTVTVDGQPITVVTTHWGLTLANRKAQLTQLLAFLQTQERFICGGDFNTYNADDTSGEDYVSLIAPMIDAGIHVANCSDKFGFIHTCVEGTDKANAVANGKKSCCIDNIVTSSNIAISNVYVDETKLTDDISAYVDHMPVIADVII